jgi:hemolysin type calcium-binding protein
MRLHLAVTALILLAITPAVADAGTVSRSGSSLVYTAAAGEANNLIVSGRGGSAFTFLDQQAAVAADPSSGCTVTGTRVSCPSGGVSGVSVLVGDGNDAVSATLDIPVSIDGGDGDDVLKGGRTDDVLQGGNGNDTLYGFEGSDRYVGGAGGDTVDSVGGGTDTLDCTGGGLDKVQRDQVDKLANCSGPGASLSVAAPKLRKFVKRGLRFSVNCAEPCAVAWQLVAADRRTRKPIRRNSGLLSRDVYSLDPDGFPVLSGAGPHPFTATALGKATKKGLGRLRKAKVKLTVVVVNSASAEQTLTKTLTLKR